MDLGGDYMNIPKNIKVTNKNGQTMAFLSPRADGLKDCYPDVRLNGESTLEFLLPATSEKIAELTPECEIHAGNRVYIIRKDDAIETVRDENNKLWAKFMAVEKWYELDTSYVEPSISNDPTARPPADLAVIIVGGGSNLSGNRYATGTAAHALYAILQWSGWTLGTVDVTGIRDLEAEKVSRLELIKMIQDIWGGYLVFDSINKIIHLRDAGKWQPYTGFQVRYRKNLKHITRTQSNKIVTKLYPFGHDDLDIAKVNGGKKYITNHSYTSREYVGIYKNQDIYDQEELLEKSIAELELICRPRYLYKVKLVDVRVLPEYEHEDFKLGDMADINDPDIAPDNPRPRIIRHKYNLFQPWQCELDIGDPEERLIEQLKASFNTTGFIDNKFNGNGQMSGNYLEDLTVTDAKIKNLTADKITAGTIDANLINVINLNASNITTGYLSADRIKTGSLTINHMESGFVKGLNLLENPVFSSYAQQVNTIDGKVSTHATLIQQNASAISLQATKITGMGQEISSLTITSNQIQSQVRGLDDDINGRYGVKSEITQMSDSIRSKVSYTDYNGREIASLINQEADRITISAKALDLNGVTTIHDEDNRYNYAMFRWGDFGVFHNDDLTFSVIRNSIYSTVPLHIPRGETGLAGNNITSYYDSNRCFIDLDDRAGRLTIRDMYGYVVGYVDVL